MEKPDMYLNILNEKLITDKDLPNIEAAVNALSADRETRRIRTAAADFVRERIMPAAEKRVKELGITDELLVGFGLKKQPEYNTVCDILTSAGFSEERRKQLCKLAANHAGDEEPDFGDVYDEIRDRFLSKELDSFFRKIDVVYNTQYDFLYSVTYTDDDTVSRIAEGLGLTKTEAGHFRSLIIQQTFYDLSALRPELKSYMAKKKIRRIDLLDISGISDSTYRAFTDENYRDGTSQETLLKLVIGLRAPADDAKGLLGLAGSGFYMRRDLVVLACIGLGIYRPDNVYYILERFGDLSYREDGPCNNIYQERTIEKILKYLDEVWLLAQKAGLTVNR